jgi:phage/plasmid-like protein (TIGR03299 family)
MAHNLEFRNGSTSFFTVKELAWHKLGVVLDNCATSKEAIELARMNYEVKRGKVFVKFDDEAITGIKGKEVPNSYAIYRNDTKDIFTSGGNLVSAGYTIVQNKDAFTFFDNIVGEGAAIYETAGVIGKGETIFITAKLPEKTIITPTDIIDNYLLLTMGHDGISSIQAMFTPIRVVCNNTLNMALNNNSHKVRFKHTTSVHDNLKKAHQIMGITKRMLEYNKELIDKLINKKVDEYITADYFNSLFLTTEELQNLANLGSHEKAGISPRKLNSINKLFEYYQCGAGQNVEYAKNTAFGLYSAVTGFLQNVKTYNNLNHESNSKKMADMYLGTSYSFGEKALSKVLTL